MAHPYEFSGGRAIHVFAKRTQEDVDDPDKPGHDELDYGYTRMTDAEE
jgi:hypothetical protein